MAKHNYKVTQNFNMFVLIANMSLELHVQYRDVDYHPHFLKIIINMVESMTFTQSSKTCVSCCLPDAEIWNDSVS